MMNMTYAELVVAMRNVLGPDASVEVDNYGQIVVFTGLAHGGFMPDDTTPLVPFGEEP